jgi:hypothetical protein
MVTNETEYILRMRVHTNRSPAQRRHEVVRCIRTAALPLLAASLLAPALHAQWMQASTAGSNGALGAAVGSDQERYVRAMLVAGSAPLLPWGMRALSAADLDRLRLDTLRSQPWRGLTERTRGVRWLAPSLITTWNSGYAWGANDGAIPPARGLTGALGVGGSVRHGPLTIIAAPSVIISENAAFPLLPNGQIGRPAFRDGTLGAFVDRPQRFGDGTLTLIDAGQSQIRLDFTRFMLGAGTQNIGWGTSEQFAPILGPNAAGFPHAFVGTPARGLRLPGLGTVSTRYFTGRLEQSAYSPVDGSRTYQSIEQPGTVRLATGLAASWIPAFAPRFELGATRLFISPFFPGSRKWRTLRKPLGGLFKADRRPSEEAPGDELGDLDNQLGTLYARWHLPRRGAEFTLEWLREDNSFDSRDLIQEPEQNAAVVAGFRIATHRSPTRLSMLTVELFDGDIAPIGRQRDQGNLYIHLPLRQGATHRGQLLGAPIGVGAMSGQRIDWERFDSTGSWRFVAERWNRRFQRIVGLGSLTFDAQTPVARSRETAFDLGATRLLRRTRGPALTLGGGIGFTQGFNFSSDRANLRLQAGVRGW